MELIETLRVKIEKEALKKAKESPMFDDLIKKVARKKVDPYQAADAILREYLK